MVDFEIVEDVVVGSPACASREEHLTAFERQLWILIDDFCSIVMDLDTVGDDVDTKIMRLKVFHIGRFKIDDVVVGIRIFGDGDVTG